MTLDHELPSSSVVAKDGPSSSLEISGKVSLHLSGSSGVPSLGQ